MRANDLHDTVEESVAQELGQEAQPGLTPFPLAVSPLWPSLPFGQVTDRLGLHQALRKSPSLRAGGEKAGGDLGDLACLWCSCLGFIKPEKARPRGAVRVYTERDFFCIW